MNGGAAFTLRLLGTPAIVSARGDGVTGSATQRHRIALLALLALAPRHTASRDKLMGLLWPERDAEGARQLLNQAVYQLRKALGDDVLTSTGDELILDPTILEVDALAFESAAQRGAYAEAITRYEGPFLDGFFLSDAPEFDRWAERERDRLASVYTKSLEALAVAAEERGDLDQAVALWKQRAAQDPYDSRVALRLMQTLDATGNRAGALQHGTVHQRLLRDDLDAELPADVAAFAEQLRTHPGTVRAPAALPVRPADADRDRLSASASLAGVPSTPPSATPAPPRGPPPAGRRYAVVAALVLVVAAVAALAFRTRAFAPGPVVRTDATIAVFPLTPLGSTPDDAVLADGVTEELIGLLVQIEGLRVIGSTSAFAFRDRKIDLRSMRDSLGVGHFLEGSLQKSDARLRVRVRLVDTRDGATLWSRTYDRELRDVFAVQEDIARAVAGELGGRFGAVGAPARRKPTENVAAYELYLRGSDRALLRSDSAARRGLEFFQRAIALDSSYAAAYAGLGRMYARVASAEPLATRRKLYQLGEQAARTALALDESLAEAHATLGTLRMVRFDWEGAERHLMRSLQLDSTNALTHEWLVTLSIWRERPADALRHAERAVRNDPLSPTAHAELARALLFNRRCDEAVAKLDRLVAVQPPLLRAAPLLADCYALLGDWTRAISVLRPQAERGRAQSLGHLGFLVARSGQREEALRIRTRLLAAMRQGWAGAYDVGLIHAGLREYAEAMPFIAQGIEDGSLTGSPGNPGQLLIMGPLLDDLRADPGFTRIRDRLGLQKR